MQGINKKADRSDWRRVIGIECHTNTGIPVIWNPDNHASFEEMDREVPALAQPTESSTISFSEEQRSGRIRRVDP